ncbi:MAG: T9SS type A sorting domain-containing protein, partial [Bacteroidetes bacterium]|nr:T9SS type A sorting domain-containing protein [Bacteroidota bacterium]
AKGYLLGYEKYKEEQGGNTSIKLPDNGSELLKVYPNPTKEYLNLSKPLSESGILEFYNLQGQLLETYQVEKGNKQLSVKQLPKGSYLLKITLPSTSLHAQFYVE